MIGIGLPSPGQIAALICRPAPSLRAKNLERLPEKRILITGASSGIGRATAIAAAEADARVVLVARREPELKQLCEEIHDAGGRAVYRACDLADDTAVAGLLDWVREEVGVVDVLVNNAGHSIRRPVAESLDRMHDFRRTMLLNYFGPVQLTIGLLPAMLASGNGHVINVGTWTVPTGTSPRFAAYHSSKMALTGFGQCLDAELSERGIAVTAVHFPLVHTAMSAPTPKYRKMPGLTPPEAAEWILNAIRQRPTEVVPLYVPVLRALSLVDQRALGRLLLKFG